MQKLYFFWEELKSSFWFVPIVIIVLSVVMAFGLIYLDSNIVFKPGGIFQYIFTGSINSARSVLSTISGAMIGVAGTVFSITLVALTLASAQFGSRLLRNFMHERINQVVLGTYISTYVYCLIVLNSIKDNEQVSFLPSFSVFFAILAAAGNIILLIIFIHHIAISIQADKVISDIYESLEKNIAVLFPEEMGDDFDWKEAPAVESLKKNFSHNQHIASKGSGYLQYIDNQLILDSAIENNLLFNLKYRPGDYVVKDMVIGEVDSMEELEKDIVHRLQNAFIIGKTRTPQQDAEYSVRQMVEIAVRALSPGVNDPYTAIACIDNLTSTLCYLTKVKFPSKYRYDEEGNLRVIAETLTYEGMLNTAFNQIRQFSAGSPSVVIRLMEALVTIRQFAKHKVHKDTILKHAKMVLSVAEQSFNEENDLEDLRKRSKLIIRNGD